MLSKTLKIRLRQSQLLLACSLVAALALDRRVAQAATGFNLGFATNNWLLTRGVVDTTPAIISEPLDIPPACSAETETACIDTFEASAAIGTGPNGSGNVMLTTWSWTNPSNGPRYFISFKLLCDEDLGCLGNAPGGSYPDYATFQVGSNTIKGLSGVGGFADAENEILLPGETITFKIYQPINGDLTSVSVNNFNASVPGPLPATGAATAFGFSRRLRRRIKGELPPGSRKRPAPTHPSSYLNLSPTVLQSLPVSFSYTAMPHRPTLANSFATRHGLPAMSPAPVLEPAANDIPAMQG